jgi:hypothetical protein
MKKTSVHLASLFCLLIVLFSCKKESLNQASPISRENIINVSVAQGQTYVYNAGASGSLSIRKQASHYYLSQTGFDDKNTAAIYTYTPAKGFAGSDEVALTHTVSALSNIGSYGGGSCHNGNNYSGNKPTGNLDFVIKIKVTQ